MCVNFLQRVSGLFLCKPYKPREDIIYMHMYIYEITIYTHKRKKEWNEQRQKYTHMCVENEELDSQPYYATHAYISVCEHVGRCRRVYKVRANRKIIKQRFSLTLSLSLSLSLSQKWQWRLVAISVPIVENPTQKSSSNL